MCLVIMLVILVGVVLVLGCSLDSGLAGEDADVLAGTELVVAFTIFRHGDRTPDDEELNMYKRVSTANMTYLFYPYGKKALTNKGKQRGYLVGEHIRQLYDGFISPLYLPDEITVRATNYARTQMTALAALSAIYPPLPAQTWNPYLEWQPIPYTTLPYEEDDLLFWSNCPKYTQLRNRINQLPQVKKWIEPYRKLFSCLTYKTGSNYTVPEDVYFLDNLFQALNNVGIKTPKWAQEVMPQIKELTKIAFAIMLYNDDMIKYASGVMMQFILNTTDSAIQDNCIKPKLYLFSAHEDNVAALMAATRVFVPHQPKYGATFTLQLRRKLCGGYGFAAIYAREAGGPGKLLPINGCGGDLVCDYEKFVSLTKDVAWNREELFKNCNT